MTILKVLGIGSPFGHDQAGWEVIKVLQTKKSIMGFSQDQLEMACYDRPGMALLDLLTNTQTAILIDAVKTKGKVGQLHRFYPQSIEIGDKAFSSHDLGVAQALQMGAILKVLPKEIIVYGISIHDVYSYLDEPITISQGIHRLAREVERDITRILKGGNSPC